MFAPSQRTICSVPELLPKCSVPELLVSSFCALPALFVLLRDDVAALACRTLKGTPEQGGGLAAG